MTELLDVVDDLTLPRNVKVPTDDGHAWATEDPLLTQLEQAVSSTLNSGSGAGGSPWSRNVLDSAALHQASLITATIGDWCRIQNLPVRRDPIADLRAWHAARLGSDNTDTDPFYINQMRAWAGQIRHMVNPPKTIEITAPCPACGQGAYTNDLGEKVPNPLQLSYRPESGSIWADAKALCRACQVVWDTEWRLRELRHDIDAKEETA
jgi:hypothetical protein